MAFGELLFVFVTPYYQDLDECSEDMIGQRKEGRMLYN